MKTTLELPGTLVKEVELRAASNGCHFEESVAELLRMGLASAHRNQMALKEKVTTSLPRIECKHAANASEEMTPERVAEILISQDGEWHRDPG